MPDKKEKIQQAVDNTKPPIADEIDEWQSVETDAQLHVKYNPSASDARSHLDAILADVDEDSLQVEEALKKEFMSDLLGGEFVVSYESDDNSLSEFGEITVSDATQSDLTTKEKRDFAKEEKRRRESKKNQNIFSHNKNNTHEH